MVYAISGLGDSSGCDVIPGSESSRGGRWAEMRSAYGCPERIYPFWFFSGAPVMGISLAETWFLSPLTEEGARARAAWRTKHPSDWYTPPYVVDTGSPDASGAGPKVIPPVVPVKFWEGVPDTTIPCQCEQSPGFAECKSKALAGLVSTCNGNQECINSNFAKLTVMTNCATLCKNVACVGAEVKPADQEIINKIISSGTSAEAAKQRSRSLMMYGAAGILAYVLWSRSKKRSSR